MSVLRKAASIVAVAVAAVAPTFAFYSVADAAGAVHAECVGGSYTFHTSSPIVMTPHPIDFRFEGEHFGCSSNLGKSTRAFLSGQAHQINMGCLIPFEGPINVTVRWSNGQKTNLAGIWKVDTTAIHVNILDVVGGLGKGQKFKSIGGNELTPSTLAECTSKGLTSGTIGIMTAKFL